MLCQVTRSLCTVTVANGLTSRLCSEPSRLATIAYNKVFDRGGILPPSCSSPVTQTPWLLPCCPCWRFGFPEKARGTSLPQFFAVAQTVSMLLPCLPDQPEGPPQEMLPAHPRMAGIPPHRPAVTVSGYKNRPRVGDGPCCRKPAVVIRLTQTSLYPVVSHVSAQWEQIHP